MHEPYEIKPIAQEDNAALAKIIRTTLEEFGANHPGTVYYDASTDTLYELFQTTGALYNVAWQNGNIVGGGGIYPTNGLPQGTCELVKMYLCKSARNIGLGSKLIALCIDQARAMGYQQIYLETMPELKQALKRYEKFGFTYLSAPMGNSGHFGCELWMIKQL